MLKRIILFAAHCAMVILLCTGCTGTVHSAVYDDDAAIAGGDRCAVVAYIGSRGENGGYRVTARSQSGSQTLWSYAAPEDGEEITVDCSLALSNDARAKIVLVGPDKSVTTLVEATEAGESGDVRYTFAAKAGTYKLKIVAADQAGYQCAVQASTGSYGN